MLVSMLTTKDNPYNPFDQYDDWNGFDQQKGYLSNGLLARFLKTSRELSPEDQNNLVSDAIDRVIRLDATGMYKKVMKEI